MTRTHAQLHAFAGIHHNLTELSLIIARACVIFGRRGLSRSRVNKRVRACVYYSILYVFARTEGDNLISNVNDI